ncbi:MAG: DcrB-related protein [Rhodocyclaceae bacterium]
MSYRCNELSLQLPGVRVIDQTLNILKLPDLGSTLIISRGALEPGQTLESAFATQMAALAQSAPDFQEERRAAMRVGHSGDIDAIETYIRFTQGEATVHQWQLACRRPGEDIMLALSYARTTPLEARDTEFCNRIKQSIELTGV